MKNSGKIITKLAIIILFSSIFTMPLFAKAVAPLFLSISSRAPISFISITLFSLFLGRISCAYSSKLDPDDKVPLNDGLLIPALLTTVKTDSSIFSNA